MISFCLHQVRRSHTNALMGVSMSGHFNISVSHPHKHTPLLTGQVLLSSHFQYATTQANQRCMWASFVDWLWRVLVNKRWNPSHFSQNNLKNVNFQMNKIVILGHRSVLSLFTQSLDLQPLRQQKRRLRIASFEASHLRGWGSLLKLGNEPPNWLPSLSGTDSRHYYNWRANLKSRL